MHGRFIAPTPTYIHPHPHTHSHSHIIPMHLFCHNIMYYASARGDRFGVYVPRAAPRITILLLSLYDHNTIPAYIIIIIPTRYIGARTPLPLINRVNDVIYQRRRTSVVCITIYNIIRVCVGARTKRSRGIDDVIMKLLIRRLRADSKTERPGSRAICFAHPRTPPRDHTWYLRRRLHFFLVARPTI